MGNQLSAPPRFQPEHLQELNKVVYKQSLGALLNMISQSGAAYLRPLQRSLTRTFRRRRPFAEDCAMYTRRCWPGRGQGMPEAEKAEKAPSKHRVFSLASHCRLVLQVFYKRGEAVDLEAYRHVLSDIR